MSGIEGDVHMWALLVSCLYTTYLSNSAVRECQIVEWDVSDSLPTCADNIEIWLGLKCSAVKEKFQAQHEIILSNIYEGKPTKDAKTSKGKTNKPEKTPKTPTKQSTTKPPDFMVINGLIPPPPPFL